MDIAKTVFLIYFGIAAILAVRYVIFMVRKLDKYDWFHEKSEFLFNYFLSILFWPMTLPFIPKYLLDPKEIIKPSDDFSIADQHREFDQFWDSPPVCSSMLRYTPHHTEGAGIFTFPTSIVLDVFQREGWRETIRYKGHYDSILSWLNGFDNSNSALTEVPEPWESFHGVAEKLLANRVGTVFCRHCDVEYQASELLTSNDSGRPGWNRRHVKCKSDHAVFSSDLYHVLPANVFDSS